MYQLKTVETQAEWKQFMALSGGDDSQPFLRKSLDLTKNPFFKHAFLRSWIVFRDATPVGRVAGVIDESLNRLHGEKVVFFSLFEAIAEQGLCNILLDEVARWGRAKGMELLRGPLAPGLALRSLNQRPVRSELIPLLERWGLQKGKNFLAFELDTRRAQCAESLLAHAERLKVKGDIRVRPLLMKHFDREMEIIRGIYNDSLDHLQESASVSAEEFYFIVSELRGGDPGMVLLVEVAGEPAAFALAEPKASSKQGRYCFVFAIGVRKAFKKLGLGPLIYTEYFKQAPLQGYSKLNAAWAPEGHVRLIQSLRLLGAKPTQSCRIYDRPL